VKKQEVSIIPTGSLAEYHEYALQNLLSLYTAKLTGLPSNYSDLVRPDATFIDAVQKYKRVVTHYLASKMELWMAIFMKPVFGVTDSNVAMDFAKSRGAIHFHSTSHCTSELQEQLKQLLK